MKKIFLLLVIAMLICLFGTAQQQTASHAKTAFLTLMGGPSFPMGDFSSKNLYNENAGFAETGFNIDLEGGYYFAKDVALSGSAFFSQYTIDANKLKQQFEQEFPGTQIGLSMDHWQYYGFVFGPMATLDLSAKTLLDVDVMTGIANANCPKTELSVDGSQATQSEDWAAVVPIRVGATARFQIGKKAYLAAGVRYIYMKPEFETTVGTEISRFSQKIESVDVTFGIGLRF